MPAPARQLLRDLCTPPNRRGAIVLLTSAVCLSAWYVLGNYKFWSEHLSSESSLGSIQSVTAALLSLLSSITLLGILPLLVVKFVLGEKLADYGVRLGDLRFASRCSLLAAPLMIAIGYASAQMPAFQAIYPLNPLARQSSTALFLDLVGQLFWYAAWEFHFRGFLQCGLSGSIDRDDELEQKSFSPALAICIQTLASTLAHFGRPGVEVFASILAGLLWGALAWRTRSLLAGFTQHWLLGASLDFFLCVSFK